MGNPRDVSKSKTREIVDRTRLMTLAELDMEIPIVSGEAVDIEAQIRKSRAESLESGQIIDNLWMARATNALQIKRLHLQLMSDRRKQLRQAGWGSTSVTFDAKFRAICKRLLTEDTYSMLIEETQKEIGQGPTEMVKGDDANGNR